MQMQWLCQKINMSKNGVVGRRGRRCAALTAVGCGGCMWVHVVYVGGRRQVNSIISDHRLSLTSIGKGTYVPEIALSMIPMRSPQGIVPT